MEVKVKISEVGFRLEYPSSNPVDCNGTYLVISHESRFEA